MQVLSRFGAGERMTWTFPKSTLRWAKLQVTGCIPLEERFEYLSRAEYRAYAPHIEPPDSVLDFACGIGRVGVYLDSRLESPNTRFTFVDTSKLTTPRSPKYGPCTKDEFYNSLDAAAEFVAVNGISADRSRFVNVRMNGWWREVDPWPDLIISMLGAGFHWPMEKSIEVLHRIAGPCTTIVFGAANTMTPHGWNPKSDLTSWFRERYVEQFDCPRYRTGEGRIVILKGKVER